MIGIFPFLVPIVLFISIAAAVVLVGPVGKALAERLTSRAAAGPPGGETQALRTDVDDLRDRMLELEERLDFAERMLARHEEAGRLSPGRPSHE